MYTNKDIRCFIMTRNRPAFLKQSLKALLSQKGGPWDIWVIDNSENNETETLVKTEYPEINYDHTKLPSNLERIQELVDPKIPYIFILHDDDLIVPNYLQTALKAINYYPNIGGVFSKYKIISGLDFPEDLEKEKLTTKHWFIRNQADFALSFWDNPSCSWTGSILKSNFYKLMNPNANLDTFGKIGDWPMLVKAVPNSNLVVFKDNYIFYRQHIGQDSCDTKTAITYAQLLNWLKFFKNFAETKRELRNIYIIRAYENALSNYKGFLSKNEQKKCQDLCKFFIEENLNIPPMRLYNMTLQNKILSPIKHLFKRIYKRNYFKKFLTDFN